MTISGFQSAIRRYNDKKGINKNSEHLIRHNFAKMYYKNGGDLVSLNYILGHKDIEMTKHYLNLLCGDVKGQYNDANPLDRMKKKGRISMKG